VTAVMGLLDHALPLLRAKGILSVVLLCRWGPPGRGRGKAGGGPRRAAARGACQAQGRASRRVPAAPPGCRRGGCWSAASSGSCR
jgi:hypothetical protein